VKPSVSDGLLEVVGIKGTFDMGTIQSGVTKPKKIAQTKTVKMICKRSVPVQVDGEPWREDKPCTITITHLNQARMLTNISKSTANEI
jgi:diacylglycerol kinase (ATP)